jgi:hypothetical protein
MDRRKFPRAKTRNFISFVTYDEDGQIESQKTGTAMDVSQGGILLETAEKIVTKSISLIATSINNMVIEIRAEVVYSRQASTGKFKNGISLRGKPDENVQFATSLIRAYNLRKKAQNRKIFL